MRFWLHTVGGLALSAVALQAQARLNTGLGGSQIIGSDLAVLEAGEDRQDLKCRVKPDKAFVGFDMRFHASYDVFVPLDDLQGLGNALSVLFRVSPEGKPGDAVYFSQRIRVPEISEGAKGEVLLQGSFDLGEGKYKVEWLMRDQGERVCSDTWEVEAALERGDRDIQPSLAAGAIDASPATDFIAEAHVVKPAAADQLRLKILMNFAPQKALASALRPIDTSALTNILRLLGRDNRIAQLTLVAFNLNDERVIYRQDASETVNFPALGQSLNALNLGTVNLQQLADKASGAKFLADLIETEVAAAGRTGEVDAVIFAGPKTVLDEKVPSAQLRPLAADTPPLFYLNYAANPYMAPWRDTIGEAVKTLKGVEYTISRPRDLWNAVSEMVGHVVKSRNRKGPGSVIITD
jgi:hypothetical protein